MLVGSGERDTLLISVPCQHKFISVSDRPLGSDVAARDLLRGTWRTLQTRLSWLMSGLSRSSVVPLNMTVPRCCVICAQSRIWKRQSSSLSGKSRRPHGLIRCLGHHQQTTRSMASICCAPRPRSPQRLTSRILRGHTTPPARLSLGTYVWAGGSGRWLRTLG